MQNTKNVERIYNFKTYNHNLQHIHRLVRSLLNVSIIQLNNYQRKKIVQYL